MVTFASEHAATGVNSHNSYVNHKVPYCPKLGTNVNEPFVCMVTTPRLGSGCVATVTRYVPGGGGEIPIEETSF